MPWTICRLFDQWWSRREICRCLSSTGFDGGFQLPLSRLLGEGVASVLDLELDRRDEADLAVYAAKVELMRVIVSTAGSRGLVVEALE